MRKGLIILLAGLVLGLTAGANAAPKPSEIPLSWELNFVYYPFQSIQIRLPGDNKPKVYWYLRYTVTNNTGQDIDFFPLFWLYLDTGKIIRDDLGVNPLVLKAIRKRHNASLLEDPVQIIGKLLQGEDNAREGVAIWKDFDQKAKRLNLFVSGISGETRIVTGKGKKPVILRKTLDLWYQISGDPLRRSKLHMIYKGKKWIMR